MTLSRIVSMVIIIAMAGVSAYGWVSIPEGTEIARHWDIHGEPNGFSPRSHILIGMPLFAVALSLLFMFVPALEPRKEHAAQNTALLAASWVGSLGVLLAVHAAIVYAAVEGQTRLPLPQGILFASCVLIMLIGNFTAKSRSNFFLGVRTPWTLSSEHSWVAANRTAGWLFVLSAAAAMATSLALDTADGFKVLLAGVISAALISIVVSFLAWRSDPARAK